MNKNYLLVVLCISSISSSCKSTADESICETSKKFYDYANSLNSWDEYHKIMVMCSVKGTKIDRNHQLSVFDESQLQDIYSCVYGLTFAAVKDTCSLKKYVSYEGNTTDSYRRDALIQDKCAVYAAQSAVLGQTYLQTCFTKLGLSK